MIVLVFQRPADQHPAQIQQRVADGAHLPVDERRHLRLVAAQQNIAQMRVAVHDSRLAVGRAVGLQPVREFSDRKRFGLVAVVPVAFQQPQELRNLALAERNPAA